MQEHNLTIGSMVLGNLGMSKTPLTHSN